MIALDTNVLIYAATLESPFGPRIRSLIYGGSSVDCVGSVVLLTEALTKLVRKKPDSDELHSLRALFSRLTLLPVNETTARLSVTLGARFNLKAMDAIHLATAVNEGADQFVTNNRKDFPKSIAEIDIVYPEDLPDPERSPQ